MSKPLYEDVKKDELRDAAVEWYKTQWSGGPSSTRVGGFKDGYNRGRKDALQRFVLLLKDEAEGWTGFSLIRDTLETIAQEIDLTI